MKLARGLLASIPLAFSDCAYAQQFSGRVVTMIVNYTAGGATDVDARIVARHLAKHLQGLASVVVRNVGGAGGNIGVTQPGESERDRLNIGFFTSMSRTVFMPHNAPAAAVANMRGVFEKLALDSEFIAYYEKVSRCKPRFSIGAAGEAIIAELGKVQPSFLKFFRDFVNAGR